MSNDSDEWTWEPPVSLRKPPEEINNDKQRFKAIVDAVGGSRTSVANRMWMKMMSLVEQDPSILDIVEELNNSVAIKYKQAIITRNEISRLRTILEISFDGDEIAFVDWCESENISELLYKKVTKNNKTDNDTPVPEWREKIIRWLVGGPLSDGKAHNTDEIKTAASNDGVLEVAGDWPRLRSVASELGYTTDKKGWWMKPRE